MTLPEASLALASYDAGAHVASLLALTAQLPAASPDTLLMRQVGSDPTVLQRVAEGLRALMTIALLALTVAVVPAAWNFRKSHKKINDLLDRVYADINPITHHAARIAENVDYVSTAIRADVQRTSATLGEANARLQAAVREAERRAKEFDALLSVVQEEAEATFVSAAATMRGVRTGVGQLRDEMASGKSSRRARRRAAARFRELAEAAPADAEWVDSYADLPAEAAGSASASAPPFGGRPAGPVAVPDLTEDDVQADLYDLGEARDGEIERPEHESGERPRVRPRRERDG